MRILTAHLFLSLQFGRLQLTPLLNNLSILMFTNEKFIPALLLLLHISDHASKLHFPKVLKNIQTI